MDKIKTAGNSPATLIHSRGYLPHIEGADIQMLTYRLADAVPQSVLQLLSKSLTEQQKRELTETTLDAGYGNCWLARPDIAQIVIENWQHFHNKNYSIIAYVVMPNHVHILIRVFSDQLISHVVHKWKSYTAKQILTTLNTSGEIAQTPIWQAEYWDRYSRHQNHLDAAINYIHQNPVKAGLVKNAEDWPWSTAGSAGGPPAQD